MNPQPTNIVPGTYTIRNEAIDQVLDLSGADHKTCIGYLAHGGENQRWIIDRLGAGYTIQNARSKTYMTVDASLANGTTIVGSAFPVAWDIQLGNAGWTIGWPNSRYFLELDYHADPNPQAAELQLWRNENTNHFQRNRIWTLVRVDDKPTSANAHNGDSNTVSETVIDASELGKGLNIVTTTTTTTVTKVVRVQ
ncbi:hypothetical protein K525DRAFT_283430 [Schizophyllum commune Loenen D]|nr:hypothetical protein K525DRAFT_283430 [Schizophyllum commune Loenen D]